ncbi:MAG: aspartyl-tRNA synthetase [Acidobacteria bacterium]|nr:aspartyl-tRNA synthetase [Acidobacteriota bacterium]
MRTVFLTDREVAALVRRDPGNGSDNGWRGLLVRLQQKVDRSTGRLHLDTHDLEQIPHYAFDYGNRDWEAQLRVVFESSLGSALGR